MIARMVTSKRLVMTKSANMTCLDDWRAWQYWWDRIGKGLDFAQNQVYKLLLSAKHYNPFWTPYFSANSVKATLSKPSHAYVWGLFFGINRTWWAFYHGSQCLFPVFLGVFKESLYIDIVHQHDTHYCGKAREAPWAADAFLQQCYEQICNKSHPHLYLDGIGTLAVEVSEREVLLYLPKELM